MGHHPCWEMRARRGKNGPCALVGCWPSTVRSDEWPAWFSFWFSGRWRALAKGTAWHGGISLVFMPGGRHENLDLFRGAVS